MAVFSIQRRVEFSETDAAGIAHFSSMVIYMEQAEHALFRQIGLSVFPQIEADKASDSRFVDDELFVTWPRVHISLDFLGPARFEDLLEIDVSIQRLGKSSVTFEHQIRCQSRPIARGKSISVCCKIDSSPGHELLKQTIPAAILKKLTPYLQSV